MRCRLVIPFVIAMLRPIHGADMRFASGTSALAIPFDLHGNNIYLSVSVNESRPLSFLLDTGASHSILSLQHARSFEMSLERLDKVDRGIGAAYPDPYLITDSVSFHLPGVTFSGDKAVAISLDSARKCLQSAGTVARDIDGIFGQDFLSKAVVVIDYPARRINLYAPENYSYTGKGTSLALEIDSQLLFVRAQLKAPGRQPVTASWWSIPALRQRYRSPGSSRRPTN